jgi:hypothetical protein
MISKNELKEALLVLLAASNLDVSEL